MMTQPNEQLAKESISLVGLVMLSLAGIIVVSAPMGVAVFISGAGPAAIWPIILGFVFFLIVSLPILEYTRIASFAGGYYGLSELGFGRAAGKFTALANYIFYALFWEGTNAFYVPMIIIDTIYYLYGYMLPIWVWILLSFATIILTQVMAHLHPTILSKTITYATIGGLIVLVLIIADVLLKTPYKSAYYLNPANAYGGLTGIALATAVSGFWTYVGYGTPLFYSEEAKNGRRTVWRAIFISLAIAATIYALTVYAIAASVPVSYLSTVASSMFPEIPAWIHYIPASVLLAFSVLAAAIAIISFGSGGGSQARLLWSMARDNFIRSNWLKKLGKNRTPINAIIIQTIIAIVFAAAVQASMVHFFGYNAATVATSFYAIGAGGTIIWYFHHFIPEFGLFGYLLKNKKLKYSRVRMWVIGLIIPIFGMALFIYTFYLGVISNLVEPYFAFVMIAVASIIGITGYVIYKARRNSLGESVVSYMAAEVGKEELSEKKKPEN